LGLPAERFDADSRVLRSVLLDDGDWQRLLQRWSTPD